MGNEPAVGVFDNQSTNQTTKQPINQPTIQTTNQCSGGMRVNELPPGHRPTNQLTNQLTIYLVNVVLVCEITKQQHTVYLNVTVIIVHINQWGMSLP